MEIRTAAVVGLGLVGGSVARDLAARGVRVAAYDRNPSSLRDALREGIVETALDPSLAGLAGVELLVVAVPVSDAPTVLAAARPHLHDTRLVTDVGSTKETVVAAAEALGVGDRFVGSHPLAGNHRSGWEASRRELFAGARTYLCPTRVTSAAALALAAELWRALGAIPEVMDAAAHDAHLALTSHLPQATATALAGVLAGADVDRSQLGTGGRDMTRLAGGSPEMWTAIALDNAPALAAALQRIEGEMRNLRSALLRGDADEVRRFYTAGREWFDRSEA